MLDLWDTNPDHVFKSASDQPAPASNGEDHLKEVRLKDHRGRLRPPAYVLIALVTALVATLLLIAGLMLAPR